MKNLFPVYILFLFFFKIPVSEASDITGIKADHLVKNADIISPSTGNNPIGYIRIRGNTVGGSTHLSWLQKDVLNPEVSQSLELRETRKDVSGYTQHRYTNLSGEYPGQGPSYYGLLKNGLVASVDGSYQEGKTPNSFMFPGSIQNATDVPATAVTAYSGTVSMITDLVQPGIYRLKAKKGFDGIWTQNMNNMLFPSNLTEYYDADNNWTDTTPSRYAHDVHYGTQVVYDWFLNRYGRNSYDNNGSVMRSFLNYGVNDTTTSFDGQYFRYGSGNAQISAPVSLDLVAHEVSYLYVKHLIHLGSSTISHAIGEAVSDCFASVIRYSVTGVPNFLIGDQIHSNGQAYRNMANPNQYNHSDTYNGLYWSNSLYVQAGVLNYWFYLLWMGGSGINDNNDAYSVNALGPDIAIDILYRTLEVYSSSHPTFQSFRDNTIRAALDLYGPCSNEVIQITNAWHAVGVGDAFDNQIVSRFSIPIDTLCTVPATVDFYNQSINGPFSTWYFGDGNTSNQINPLHTYTAPGTYDVTLISTGGPFCPGSDTITYNALIHVTNGNGPQSVNCHPLTVDTCCSWGIYNVKYNSINHFSDRAAIENYEDNSCSVSAIIPAGSWDSIKITTSPVASESVSAWIDFNGNSSFDSTELVFNSLMKIGLHRGIIQVPGNVILNTPLRMRITSYFGNTVHYDACESPGKGQAEDYAVNFIQSTLPPVADFISDKTTGPPGTTITFTDRSLNGCTSWLWKFEGGTPSQSTDRNPVITYNSYGTFKVTLTVMNNQGADSVVRNDYIIIPELVNLCNGNDTITTPFGYIFDSGGNGSYSSNESCFLLIDPVDCHSTISFKFNTLNTQSTVDHLRVYDGNDTTGTLLMDASGTIPAWQGTAVANSGTMFLWWVSDQSNNSSGFQANYFISEGSFPPPLASFSVSDINPLYNSPVYFTDLSSNQPLSWYWDFGDGYTSTLQNPVHSFLNSGVNTITLIAGNCAGSDTVSFNINVQVKPVLVSTVTSVNENISCNDSLQVPVVIHNTGPGLLTFSFDQNSLTGYSWISVTAPADTLNTGDSIDVIITMNTVGIPEGDYSPVAQFLTNDSINAVFSIPLSIHLTGSEKLELQDTCINFGLITEQTSYTDTLLIINSGCDTLFFSSIVSGNSAFVVNVNSIAVAPYSQYELPVTFIPPAIGTYISNLTLLNSDKDTVVCLEGSCGTAPVLNFLPAAPVYNIPACTPASAFPVYIHNTGGSPLVFNINGTLVSAPAELLFLMNGVNTGNQYTNLLNAIAGNFSNYIYDTLTTTLPAVLENALTGKDILILPEQSSGTISYYPSLAPVVNDFLFNGGKVIIIGSGLSSGYANRIFDLNLFTGNYQSNAVTGNVSVVEPSDVHMQGVPTQFPVTADLYYLNITNSDKSIIASYNNYDVVTKRKSGLGEAVYIGFDFEVNSPATDRVISNAVRYLPSTPPSWFSVDQANGTVMPGDSFLILITVNTQDFVQGTYTVNLHIENNDTLQPYLIQPFTFNIGGSPCSAINSQVMSNCAGQVNFSETSVNVPLSWNWDFGDGQSSALPEPVNVYSQAGIYTVTLITCNADGCDTATTTVNIPLITGPAVTCIPYTVNYCCNSGITRVELNTIDNSSSNGAEGYRDFTCTHSTVLNATGNYLLSITSSLLNENVRAWIDWNNDLDFSGFNESIALNHSGMSHTSTLTVPDSASGVALNTPVRMRIGTDKIPNPVPTPCTNSINGQFEDYTVIISNASVSTEETHPGLLQYSLSPNPFNGILNLSLILFKHSEMHIAVYDVTGRIIRELNIPGILEEGQYTYPLHIPAAGSYYVTITANGHTYTEKIINITDH